MRVTSVKLVSLGRAFIRAFKGGRLRYVELRRPPPSEV